MNKFLAKIVAWITSGYPEGVPGPDRVPLFALLKRRLTDDEVKTVATELMDRGEFDARRHRRADHPDHRRAARARRTSNGCEPAWPPRAGRSTTRATPRRRNSRPAPRRRPVWPVGAVGAARGGGASWPAAIADAAGSGRRRTPNPFADNVIAGRRGHRRRRRRRGVDVGHDGHARRARCSPRPR